MLPLPLALIAFKIFSSMLAINIIPCRKNTNYLRHFQGLGKI